MMISAAPTASSAMSLLTPSDSTSTTQTSSTSTTGASTTAAASTTATGTSTSSTDTSTSSSTSSSGGSGGGSGAGGGGGVTLASSLAELISNYNFKVGDKNYVSSISSSNGEYTATVSGVGSVSGTSESAVEAAIAVKVSAMA